MNQTPLDIEQIIREVIAELRLQLPESVAGCGPAGTAQKASCSAQRQLPSPAAAPSPEDAKRPQEKLNPADTLLVSNHVVTLAEVSGRLDEIRRVVVPPGAVITPAVRDHLQQRGISLVFATEKVEASGRFRLVLVTTGRKLDPVSLIRSLSSEHLTIEPHTVDCLIAATDRLAAEVLRPDTLGLLLTRQTAAGLCLANRHPGVRAILGTGTAAVAADVAAVGANLLVVDPTMLGLHQLKQVVREFCRGGPRECPAALQQRLAEGAPGNH